MGGWVPRSKGLLRACGHPDRLGRGLCLKVSNLARQLKFNPEVGDDRPVITHLTASLWFRSMEPTITSSTSRTRRPNNERKIVAAVKKQVKSMQDGGKARRYEGSLEDPSLDEELRVYEEGVGENT